MGPFPGSAVMMSDQLKPCPFCAAEIGVSPVGYRGGSRCVICQCSCNGPVKITTPEALKAWNSRPVEAHQAERILLLQRDMRQAQFDRVKLRAELKTTDRIMAAVKWWRTSIMVPEKVERNRASRELIAAFDAHEPTKGGGGGT